MATVNKDFKIKSGLVVEGSSATVGGFNVLTKKQDDQDYIVGLIGGTSTSANTANTVVKRNADGDFAAGTITADIVGTVSSLSNHDTDDLAEGSRLYFTNQRAIDAGDGVFDGFGAASAAQSAAQTFATNADTAVRTAVTTEIGTAKSEAINAAAADATTKANNAKSGAEATAAADATSKANAAVTSANGYTDTAISTEVTNRNSAIASAISTEVSDRNAAITSAVAAVVDSAPAALDTLNELALALADSPDTVTNLTTRVGTKAPLASPALTGVPTAPTAAANTNTTQVATTAFAKAEADAAQEAAEDYADTGLALKQDILIPGSGLDVTGANITVNPAEMVNKVVEGVSGSSYGLVGTSEYLDVKNTNGYNKEIELDIAAVEAKLTTDGFASQTDISNAIDAVTTSDIEEGSNQYFTDARAKASAAALLTGATKTNITITGTGAGLTITAENGVADSTTSDLAEGTNKYFTDARAVDALEAVVPNFTAVELNSVAKQVAATLSAPTAGVQTAHAFAKADYRSAEYLVKIANGNHTEISKVLLTLDSTDGIAITEYGIVGTNGSLGTVSAGISGANVQLLVTTANNTSTVTVVGTLLA